MSKRPSMEWLSDPRVFAVGRLDPVSDHIAHPDTSSARAGAESPFRRSLAGVWKCFAIEGAPDWNTEFVRPDFDVSGWADITIPGHMQTQGFGRPWYVNTQYPWDGLEAIRPPEVARTGVVGLHARDFDFAPRAGGGREILVFEGVETAFCVWLNGEFVGYGEDGFTPSAFDATDLLRPGTNRLAVEVRQRSSASWIEDQDFWRLTGIFRDVRLEHRPAGHVWDIDAVADLSEDLTSGTLRLALRTRADAPAGAVIEFTLSDPAGRLIGDPSPSAFAETVTRVFPVDRPALWSAEEPNLHELTLTVHDGAGGVIEVIRQKVGFRRFEMRNGLMTLNGRRIVFRGVNRHDFSAERGRAIGREEMLWDIRFMKRNNINAVRTSHYPNQSEWYRLCDEYGVYLIDEANLESHGSWQKDGVVAPTWVVPGDDDAWSGAVLDRARSMVERDKNHPSVLIWSCGNESFGGKVIFEMSEWFRRRDPTRLVHYEGVFQDRRFDATSDMESRMYTKPQDVVSWLENDPKKPFIMCEYMHAMGNSCGGMYLYTDLARKYPLYQGGFVWDYIDQALAVPTGDGTRRSALGGDFGDRPTDWEFCCDGIVTAWRETTPKVQEVKALYQSLLIAPDRSGARVVNENLFVSTDIGRFHWSHMRDGVEVDRGDARLSVPAGAEGRLELPIAGADEPGDHALIVSFHLNDATPWAEAGFETAFGETTWLIEAPVAPAVRRLPLRVVHGDLNLGVHVGEEWFALFSRVYAGPVSLRAAGFEVFKRPPRLAFWRAVTDNDRGNRLGFRSAPWHTADLYQRATEGLFEVIDGEPTITHRYALPGLDTTPSVVYRVGTDGRIHVTADFPGGAGLPDLPLFGLRFFLDPTLDRFRWFGAGPEENYSDRRRGARLGAFESRVIDNLSPYTRPQECGNRMDTRSLDVVDAEGRGVRFTTEGRPFEFSVLPWDAFELQNAARPEELPPSSRTVVQILAEQMGVGGDDSWGAPVHEPHLVHGDRPLTLRFAFRPI